MTSWQYGQPQVGVQDTLKCGYCGEELRLGERCIERFRGVVGRGEKSGQPTLVADGYDPEDSVFLHEECEEMMHFDAFKSEMSEDEELMKFCAGCGSKFNGD